MVEHSAADLDVPGHLARIDASSPVDAQHRGAGCAFELRQLFFSEYISGFDLAHLDRLVLGGQ